MTTKVDFESSNYENECKVLSHGTDFPVKIEDSSTIFNINGSWTTEGETFIEHSRISIHGIARKSIMQIRKIKVDNKLKSLITTKCTDPTLKLNSVVQESKSLVLANNSNNKSEEKVEALIENKRNCPHERDLVTVQELSSIITDKMSTGSSFKEYNVLQLDSCLSSMEGALKDIELDCYNIHRAVQQDNLVALQYLLAKGADPDEPDWTSNGDPPILVAASRQNICIIKALCDAGCDMNACSVQGETALHVAVNSHPINKDLVKMLLALGCNPNIQDKLKGQTALHCVASFFDDEPDVFLQLASVTDINLRDHRSNTVLHRIAATTTNISRLQQVLDLGAKPSLQNNRGETVLCVALEHNWVEGALALIHSGTDLHSITLYHETALHIAGRKNRPIVVAALIDLGVEVNACDLAGNTALHLAASRGFKQVVQLLLACPSINLNAQNKEGLTPLHVAVESGFINVVEMLVKAEEIDLNTETALLLTALDLANQGYRRKSQPEMFQVLTRELERRQLPHLS